MNITISVSADKCLYTSQSADDRVSFHRRLRPWQGCVQDPQISAAEPRRRNDVRLRDSLNGMEERDCKELEQRATIGFGGGFCGS